MGKELLLVAKALSNEKMVPEDVVISAIQAALESATRKLSGMDIGVRVVMNTKTGDYETFRVWHVVEDDFLENPDAELTLVQAQAIKPDVQLGDTIEEPMPSVEFGRIAAQTARHVIVQKLREAEKEQIVDQYKSKISQLVYGVVKKVTRDHIIVDLGGKAEAFMPRQELLPNEMFRINDRVRACLYEIARTTRGPQLMLTRAREEMLTALFRIEVPEIGENIIEIKAAARDPGVRAKISVKTNDGRIDPVGACVGMRGARVQAVSNELAGERVDIVLWDDNPAQYVINAMSPAEITSIVVDEESHTMDLAVAKEYLSQAIGRNGQNVRLASQLTGWTLNVMTSEEFNDKSEAETQKSLNLFVQSLEVEEDIAKLLVETGFSSIEEIAYVPKEELLAIDGFDEALVDELRNRANDYLLTQALSVEAHHEDASGSLMSLEGMTAQLAKQLEVHHIKTMEDLAEQSVDELQDIVSVDKKLAASLIMQARAPWFEE